MKIAEILSGKRILIWGYGREGQSTEQYCNKNCKPASVTVFEGKREEIDEDAYDLIIKSPGIIMEEDHPKYTSQTELFLEEFRDQTVGITGTKGKSTTSTMLYQALHDCGVKTVLLGNIGQPCLDYADQISPDMLVVYEMSCHQLAHTKVSPHIAVFLNLFEEHLDYYKTVEKYFRAKSNIARFQRPDDFFFVGENVPEFETVSVKTVLPAQSERHFNLSVKGEQNQYNADVVYRIAVELLEQDEETVRASLESFQGLPHRLELVATLDGVSYYDDSISTIPEATISATKSVANVGTVLVGGMDRGINYDSLVRFIRRTPQVRFICAYASGKRIYDALGGAANCRYVQDLEQAVALAKKITPRGSACILSPAAASYGYFKNFEERGEVFKQLIRQTNPETTPE